MDREPVSFHDLDDEHQEAVRRNILAVISLLSLAVDDALNHLRHSKNACVKCCIGRGAIDVLEGLEHDALLMLTTIAVRELAEAQYEKEVDP